MRIGYDCGTYNLVCCTRDGKDFKHKREINCFIEMPLDNEFVFNMMKNAGVPLIERKEAGIGYALGEAAVDIAYTMSQVQLRRPMKDGCLNPQERHAQQIMSIMMHSLIGDLDADKSPIYYSVPANAINEETDADYHSKVLESVFKSYKDKNGYTLDPYPINEALALVYAELASKSYTGLACSFGAGMVNVCYAIFGAPVFEFSIVNSGDWIDKMSAKALGESTAYVNKEKEKVDLTKNEDAMVHRVIKAQYEIMISKTVKKIKEGLEEAGNKAHTSKPIDVVIAGGTSSPNGFDTLFKELLLQQELSIDIDNIIRPKDPLYSVARGCLVAAEAHQSTER